MYVNLRLGADPDSPDVESQPLIPEFKIWGPTDQPYPDAFCLTNIGAGTALKEGDKATLQVVQVLKNGGALYNVRSPSSTPIGNCDKCLANGKK